MFFCLFRIFDTFWISYYSTCLCPFIKNETVKIYNELIEMIAFENISILTGLMTRRLSMLINPVMNQTQTYECNRLYDV